jgi:hypothetical protein
MAIDLLRPPLNFDDRPLPPNTYTELLRQQNLKLYGTAPAVQFAAGTGQRDFSPVADSTQISISMWVHISEVDAAGVDDTPVFIEFGPQSIAARFGPGGGNSQGFSNPAQRLPNFGPSSLFVSGAGATGAVVAQIYDINGTIVPNSAFVTPPTASYTVGSTAFLFDQSSTNRLLPTYWNWVRFSCSWNEKIPVFSNNTYPVSIPRMFGSIQSGNSCTVAYCNVFLWTNAAIDFDATAGLFAYADANGVLHPAPIGTVFDVAPPTLAFAGDQALFQVDAGYGGGVVTPLGGIGIFLPGP